MIEITNNLYLGGLNDMINNLSNVEQGDLIINCSLKSYITDAKMIKIEVKDDCSNKAIERMKTAFFQVFEEIDTFGGFEVYVQRSCAIIAAYLMKKRKMSMSYAIEFIKNKKKMRFFGKQILLHP